MIAAHSAASGDRPRGVRPALRPRPIRRGAAVVLVGASRATVSELARLVETLGLRLHHRSMAPGPLGGHSPVEPIALLVDGFCWGLGPSALAPTLGALPRAWWTVRRAALLDPGQEELVSTLMELGCDEVFERPIRSPRLHRWLERCASNHRGRPLPPIRSGA
ncbi:MAG: hypothetical protein DWQ36_07765 [Acidobacteria bacterium]|nr:MAG: hypothetical protein DWQ30_04060 [Acidobacteriota bacterium]REK08864.1 MAG: hypothetical protein DWQ36_07765 [Acidobacteriota bacterium]